ncbi:MAG: hypothetical protein ACR2MA_09190 [Egibacteraceae bacterium]
MSRHVTVVLQSGAQSGGATTALRLAERLLARGHRVTVFAAESAVGLSAIEGELAEAVAALLRRGLHGGTLDWVVDGAAARRWGCERHQVPGVVPGDHADLWTFVRDADVVLAPGRGA